MEAPRTDVDLIDGGTVPGVIVGHDVDPPLVSLTRELSIDALPGTIVLDSAGKVRWVAPPDASADDVVAAQAAAQP